MESVDRFQNHKQEFEEMKTTLLDKCDKVCGNKYFPLVIAPFAFLFVLLFSVTTSPIYNDVNGDSAVFRMMGFVLTHGGIPYVDFFDHKGPVLYFINALGELISPRWGLFSIQVVWCFLSMWLWFKIARLFVRPTVAFIVLCLTSVVFYIGTYNYGNLTEEWSILPASLAIYLSLAYMVKHKDSTHPRWQSLIYGLCFGAMFLIRTNDEVIQCGAVMTGIFLYIVFVQKEYKQAIANALAFFIGFVIVATPFIAYFAYHHALSEFYTGLLGFNMGYFSGGLLAGLLQFRFVIGILSICAIPAILAYAANQKESLQILVPIYILALLLVGRNAFPHYYMTLIPSTFLLAVTFIFKQNSKPLMIMASILLLMLPSKFGGVECFQFAVTSYNVMKETIKGPSQSHEYQYYEELGESEELFALIPTQERDSVWNYNDFFCRFFYHNGIIAQNPIAPVVAAQKHLPDNMESMRQITFHKPLWVFYKNISNHEPGFHYMFPTDSTFIANHYEVVGKNESSSCLLLKRID